MNSRIAPLAPFAHAPLLLLVTAFFMAQPLSTDLYLASLPSLAGYFDVPPATAQLTLSLFVLGFGLAQLITGPLSDRYGRRPVVLGGLSLYMFASILCSLAPHIWMLIGARFLQALGCCAVVVVSRALVRDAYAPEHGPRVVARAATWLSLAPIAGPILGSWLQVGFGWRAAFIALTLMAAALLVLAWRRLPETNLHKNPDATRIAGLAENYRSVLGARAFWAYALPGALSYGSIFVFISGLSFALIEVLGVPTAWFGYCHALGVSGYMVGTLVCRRLLPAHGIARMLHLGSMIALLTGIGFAVSVLAGFAHWSQVLLAEFSMMFSYGFIFPIAQSSAVTPFPRQAGTAAGLMGALYMGVAFLVGNAVGATHDGTLLPLALISCVLGTLIFASAHAIRHAPETA